ncbi:MAG: GTPase ObgE [Chloroflexi bacterium]|nr:MAG: GTPase ObgE [Chloroflexota bacterium]MBL1194451.1 GTPase ObgE [Chloroflexota bacterium]NOH11739.1 GTPase ObgE [Chloroflexota bacterium]
MTTFLDLAHIHVRSGKGGDGIVHFRREKFVPRGGPDGGDGGRGGDVVLQVTEHLNTLYSLQNQKLYAADDGGKAGGNNRYGPSADELVIPVPAGTIVYHADSNEVLGDLISTGQRLVIAQGGRGGRGNARFKNSRNQAPRVAEKGEPGEEISLRLELKLIADIGIVGVPNAGKSTFLAAVTNAKPKIADYPFTTLQPNLGVANLDEDNTLVLADIPGLIEGAHLGVGLGHDFLRHVQRTRVLIHLLDGLAEDPIADLSQINTELALFDADMANKPQVVAINKIDLPDVQAWLPDLEEALEERGYKPMTISAVAGTNVRQLLYKAAELLADAPEIAPIAELPIYRQEVDPNEFSVAKEFESWRVSGVAIERAAAMTYWEYDQSVRRFQRILETLGIDEALREAGVREGDTILIGDHELEWED